MTAVTEAGLVPMRVSKAAGLQHGGEVFDYIVLDERDGDRQLVIEVGHAEAFALAATLQGLEWNRPITYQLTAALVHSLGGRIREVRMDRILDGAYAATIEVDGAQGTGMVDARCSDALNLAVITDAPVLASAEVLAECISRQEGDSAEAALLRRALGADPMTIRRMDP
jgi:bifunctional DNase/RNase